MVPRYTCLITFISITNEDGDMDFWGDRTAGTATITNKDDLDFREISTAGNARLINGNGATTSFAGTGRTVSAGSISGSGFWALAATLSRLAIMMTLRFSAA